MAKKSVAKKQPKTQRKPKAPVDHCMSLDVWNEMSKEYPPRYFADAPYDGPYPFSILKVAFPHDKKDNLNTLLDNLV